jgi:nucleotide-binding universal stress UspA family protein
MLDGSGVSEEALPIIEALAGHPLQSVRLFRAVREPRDQGPAETYLNGVARRFDAAGLQTEVLVEAGDPAALVERAARGTDVVVLSTHGRGGFDRLRHGSVAERVVREVPMPVLLVRARAS